MTPILFLNKLLRLTLAVILPFLCDMNGANAQEKNEPVRVAIARITHGHAPWILNRKNKKDIILVGIYEPDEALSKKHAATYNLNPALFYTDLEKMLRTVKPEAVVAFGSTFEHLSVVKACAPKGVHVMVEKPLATTKEHVMEMLRLANQHKIHLLTNYETSWYASTEKTHQLVADSNYVGRIQKAVFHHGHPGPEKIGVSKEFLQWLTDPVQNGGGALTDFGCYGANIMTYLMRGEMPLSVTAVTKNLQQAVYPRVDDEATIIVDYPSAQCIIQASWNWPFNRKDLEVYGDQGYVIATDDKSLRMRSGAGEEKSVRLSAGDVNFEADPFALFAGVVRGRIKLPPYSLYSLENNVLVVRILDAARESSKTGRTVFLKQQLRH